MCRTRTAIPWSCAGIRRRPDSPATPQRTPAGTSECADCGSVRQRDHPVVQVETLEDVPRPDVNLTVRQKTCRRHRACLHRPAATDAEPPPAARHLPPFWERVRQRRQEVSAWAAPGLSLTAITRRPQRNRTTVRRHRNKDRESLLASAPEGDPALLDPFTDVVQDRFRTGCPKSRRPTARCSRSAAQAATTPSGATWPASARAATPGPGTITSWSMLLRERPGPSGTASPRTCAGDMPDDHDRLRPRKSVHGHGPPPSGPPTACGCKKPG